MLILMNINGIGRSQEKLTDNLESKPLLVIGFASAREARSAGEIMKELMRTALSLAERMLPIMCRVLGGIFIANGIVSLVIGGFVAFNSHQTPVWKALVLLSLMGIILVLMGLVIWKWFTRFMMWNLQRCRKTWGLEPKLSTMK